MGELIAYYDGLPMLGAEAVAARQEALASLEVPSLIIHGDADRLVPIEAGRLTAKCIPGTRFEVVAGMGHDYPPQR